MTEELDSNEFTCQRCMACCQTSGHIYVTEGEIARIAPYLGLEISSFINFYCDIIRPRFSIKSFRSGACMFLTETGCLIYDVRPVQCQTFPDKWKTRDAQTYCKGLQNNNLKE